MSNPYVLAVPTANETVLYHSSAKLWVWSDAQAKLHGFAIGSPAFMAGFLGVALARKWNAQRPKWRQIEDGWVELTTERMRVRSAGEAETAEFPYSLLRAIRYEGDQVAVNTMDGEQFKVRPSDPRLFRTTLEEVARPKLWRALPLERPSSPARIEATEQRAGIFSFGMPAGWALLPDLQKMSALINENVVAGVIRDVGSRMNPNVTVIRTPGPIRRDDLERIACAYPGMLASATPGSEVVGPPRRLDVGGELALAATLRFVHKETMATCRLTRVRIARGGIPYNIEFAAEDGIFDAYVGDFEAMLANWRWRDKAPAVSGAASSRLGAPRGGSFGKRLVLAVGLYALASLFIGQTRFNQTPLDISSLGPALWIGLALGAAAWKVLFTKRPGLRTQKWGRFAASWLVAVVAASFAESYWVIARGTGALASSQDQTSALLWVSAAALVAGLATRWVWSRVVRSDA